MFSQPPGGTSAGAPVFLPRSKNTHIWPCVWPRLPHHLPQHPPDPDYKGQLTENGWMDISFKKNDIYIWSISISSIYIVYMSMDSTKSTCLVCRITWTCRLTNLRFYFWHRVNPSLFQAILLDKNEDVSFFYNDILQCIQHLWTINIALKSVVKTLFSQSVLRQSHPEGARSVVHSQNRTGTWHKWSMAGFFTSV